MSEPLLNHLVGAGEQILVRAPVGGFVTYFTARPKRGELLLLGGDIGDRIA